MGLAVQAEAPPLREEADGSIRIGDSRVLLEIVIHAFQDGATPEAILQRYGTLKLPDVYAVIAYFLRHRDEVEAYLTRRAAQAADVRRQIEASSPDMTEIRARLQAARSR